LVETGGGGSSRTKPAPTNKPQNNKDSMNSSFADSIENAGSSIQPLQFEPSKPSGLAAKGQENGGRGNEEGGWLNNLIGGNKNVSARESAVCFLFFYVCSSLFWVTGTVCCGYHIFFWFYFCFS
jgi:hypothetical protein